MLFVPDDIAKAEIERLMAGIREREKRKSAEWRKNFHERYKDYIVDEK